MASVSSILSGMGINLGNLNEYPLSGNNYFVILGTSMLSFAKISGLVLRSVKTKGVNEGGINEPYIVEEPSDELNTLVLEKGYGTVDVMDMIKHAKMMILIIRGPGNLIKGVYYTSRMIVKEVALSDLEGNKSEVLIQRMTISYTYLKRATKVMKMATNGGLGNISELLNYNDNSEDQEAIQEYSAKLSAQKAEQTAARNEEKASNAGGNPEVQAAAGTNQRVTENQRQAEQQRQQEERQKEAEIRGKLEL